MTKTTAATLTFSIQVFWIVNGFYTSTQSSETNFSPCILWTTIVCTCRQQQRLQTDGMTKITLSVYWGHATWRSNKIWKSIFLTIIKFTHDSFNTKYPTNYEHICLNVWTKTVLLTVTEWRSTTSVWHRKPNISLYYLIDVENTILVENNIQRETWEAVRLWRFDTISC